MNVPFWDHGFTKVETQDNVVFLSIRVDNEFINSGFRGAKNFGGILVQAVRDITAGGAFSALTEQEAFDFRNLSDLLVENLCGKTTVTLYLETIGKYNERYQQERVIPNIDYINTTNIPICLLEPRD